MAKSAPNIRFHDPNPPDVTLRHVARVFTEVNKKRLERLWKEEQKKQK